MIGSTAHTQNIADQAMELAGQFMTEDEISSSDAYRVIENVSCVCEEAMQVLVEDCLLYTSISNCRLDNCPNNCLYFCGVKFRCISFALSPLNYFMTNFL